MQEMACYKLYNQGKKCEVMLEPAIMTALKEIAKLEKISLRELCNLIGRTYPEEDFASAIRVFACLYYRNLALVLPRGYVELADRKERKKKNLINLKSISKE